MIPLERLGLQTAGQLIDFGGKSAAAQAFAKDQLEGAVALHNMLADEGFAYLADEVGMGKTYIALGVISLMRHFHPGLRVLYVVPRLNIQEKWRKEARNFVANNWRLPDLRVKSLQNSPVVDLVVCDSLAHLVTEVHANAHRDFVLRMSSFSLALRKDNAGWKTKRRELRRLMPWLPHAQFDLRDKERFKETYARAINAALPQFDLLVVDEAHNLRHGYEHGSTRNRLLALALGREDPEVPYFPGGGPRVDRVLTLSATPLETDYKELWNQLELLGKGAIAPELADQESLRDAQQHSARSFMVRRLTGLQLGEQRFTKNMYRREWRRGGVDEHGSSLRTADDRERLVVALVQKKVSDVLAALGRQSGRSFGRRFQMGMLASFESFLETAKLANEDDDPTFDHAEQTDDDLEREGVDAVSITHLARSYRERFQEALPHPKMNAVAQSLAAAMRRGEKTLVFVRRVASVRELADKVTQSYDDWLLSQLVHEAELGLRAEIERQFTRYRHATSTGTVETEDEEVVGAPEVEGVPRDQGGSDSFFAWFFRGARKLGVASGAWFRRRRLTDEKEALSLFLDENYLDWLGGEELASLAGLASCLGLEPGEVGAELRTLAYAVFRSGSRQKRFPRRRVFRAYQEAAVRRLAGTNGELGRCARILAAELGWSSAVAANDDVPAEFPEPVEILGLPTAFSQLRRHPLGSGSVKLDPEDPRTTAPHLFAELVRRHEVLRELLSAAMSLGHPFVELWRVYVRLRGTLSRGGVTEPSVAELATAYFDALTAEPEESLGARAELEATVEHFALILDVNFPDARDKPLPEVAKYLQSTLSAQTPVGGMSGRINASMVRQFRMPGYPYVLITTDVLQEGEDLHTFAARVVHYGISWTPSAMEQRTGRVDRIGSLTHRRLSAEGRPDPERFLQVQFPYLDSSVEFVQVREIFKRMDEFVALLHRGLGAEEAHQSAVNLASAIHEQTPIKLPSTQALDSPFDVDSSLLLSDHEPCLALSVSQLERYAEHLDETLSTLEQQVRIEWAEEPHRGGRMATAWVRGRSVVRAGEAAPDARRQPFAVRLRSDGAGLALLQFVSPIGQVSMDDEDEIRRVFRLQTRLPTAKICAVVDDKRASYNLTAEVETPFHPDALQIDEAVSALERCVVAADLVEREVLQTDRPLSVFANDLRKEFSRG